MAANPQLPRPQSQLSDAADQPTREWYEFWRQLLEFARENGATQAQIAELEQRVAALEQVENFTITGLLSVRVFGSPQSGTVVLQLLNDAQAPGNTYYYGTGPTGTKGWFAVADAITQGDGIALTTGPDGITEIAHGDTSSVSDITANFSGSTVVGQISLTFDQFGHVVSRTITGRQLDHNDLNAIQGGAPGEYYHLTSAEHTKVQALPAASQPLDDDLTAIAALATTGFPVRTAANTWALRSFANGTGYTWTNPAGVAGNPTLVLDATLQSLAGQNWVLNSIPVGSGADTVTQLALGANTFPARSSAGNVAAKPITDFGLSLIDDGNAAAARTTLGAMADTQPFFVATLSAAQALVAGVNTKVNLDTDVVDPNGWFDTGTGRFTPQQAGLYSVISTIAFSRPGASTTTGQRLIAYIFKNGAQEVAVTAANLSQTNTIEQAVGLVQMNGTTDYIEMYARSDATDAYQVGAGAANTTLRAVRVSA